MRTDLTNSIDSSKLSRFALVDTGKSANVICLSSTLLPFGISYSTQLSLYHLLKELSKLPATTAACFSTLITFSNIADNTVSSSDRSFKSMDSLFFLNYFYKPNTFLHLNTRNSKYQSVLKEKSDIAQDLTHLSNCSANLTAGLHYLMINKSICDDLSFYELTPVLVNSLAELTYYISNASIEDAFFLSATPGSKKDNLCVRLFYARKSQQKEFDAFNPLNCLSNSGFTSACKDISLLISDLVFHKQDTHTNLKKLFNTNSNVSSYETKNTSDFKLLTLNTWSSLNLAQMTKNTLITCVSKETSFLNILDRLNTNAVLFKARDLTYTNYLEKSGIDLQKIQDNLSAYLANKPENIAVLTRLIYTTIYSNAIESFLSTIQKNNQSKNLFDLIEKSKLALIAYLSEQSCLKSNINELSTLLTSSKLMLISSFVHFFKSSNSISKSDLSLSLDYFNSYFNRLIDLFKSTNTSNIPCNYELFSLMVKLTLIAHATDSLMSKKTLVIDSIPSDTEMYFSWIRHLSMEILTCLSQAGIGTILRISRKDLSACQSLLRINQNSLISLDDAEKLLPHVEYIQECRPFLGFLGTYDSNDKKRTSDKNFIYFNQDNSLLLTIQDVL